MPCPLTTYVLCDPAWTQTGGRKASMSSLAVVQKTPLNHTYVMEVRMGKWTSTGLTRQLLDVFETWREKGHPPEYYIMETQGPGGTMPGHIHDAALLLNVTPPVHVPVSHARKNKNVRITLVLAPMEAKRWFFSPGLAREIFRQQQGEPHGLLGDAYMAFSMDSKLPLDGPDCLAIAMEKSSEGAPLCPPPDFTLQRKPRGLYQRSLQKMRGHRRRIRLN